jgi:RNA polymerase sigma-70 factor (ECF subfamily)
MEDEALVLEAQQGDADAFNRLVIRHQALAYNVALRIIRNAEDAADATQDAFLSAFRAIDGFHGGSFRAWLLRIVLNSCYDLKRHSMRRPATSMEAIVENLGEAPWGDERAVDPEAAALSGAALATIEAALDQLPEEQRAAVLLVDVEGLSYEEAADAMACPVGTVRSRLARGRARARDVLIESGNLR